MAVIELAAECADEVRLKATRLRLAAVYAEQGASRETLSSMYRRERLFVSENIGYHDWKRAHIMVWTNSED